MPEAIGVKRFFKILINRLNALALMILLQAILLVSFIVRIGTEDSLIYAGFGVISIIVVLSIISRPINPSYKLAFIMPILLFPVLGGMLFLLLGWQGSSRRFRRRVQEANEAIYAHLPQQFNILDSLAQHDKHAAAQAKYLSKTSGYPLCHHTKSTYLSSGEAMYTALLEDLRSAQYYILLEFFIISDGPMWHEILAILEQKVSQGVDVRVLYDDFGCIRKLPYQYYLILRKKGIQCRVFNPIRPLLDIRLNHRDHRKIVVIDGYIGYTGGMNLADEYINTVDRFGHWKDAAIRISGEAVWNLTIMFLQLWHFQDGSWEDLQAFLPKYHHPNEFENDGLVLPFSDSPGDEENVGQMCYLNIIGRATHHIYITTPYLVIDNELTTALQLAARSGVDVRIMTPGRGDKWYVHPVTRSYYQTLLKSGVSIYEYTPGFIHSKTFLVDDTVGVVGTINMDFRSLYLHFENGIWLYHTQCLADMRADFEKTLTLCKRITLEEQYEIPYIVQLFRAILRIFAPLL